MLLSLLLSAALETQTWRDIPYRPEPRHERQVLDIVAQKGATKNPVVVFVHGGGWRQGDKRQADQGKSKVFASAGLVYVAPNYRLVPEGRYPANADDIATALAWVRKNIAQYGGDPSRVFLMGHSAGAQLVAIVAAQPQHLQKAGESPKFIKGVILLDGAGYRVADNVKSFLGSMYREAFGDDPKVWEAASPTVQAAKAAWLPDFLLVTAGMAGLGPNPTRQRLDRRSADQSAELAKVVRSKGAKAEMLPCPTKNHSGVNKDLGDPSGDLTKKVLAWIKARA